MATLATQPAREEPIITDTEQASISERIDPSHDRIAALAYAYWLESGSREGADQENWLRAEQELIGKE